MLKKKQDDEKEKKAEGRTIRRAEGRRSQKISQERNLAGARRLVP